MTDYDYRSNKTIILLSSKIPTEVALNVVGHLCLAIGAYSSDGLMGKPVIKDASGINHCGISRYPIIALKARPSKLRKALEIARESDDIFLVDYPRQMLDTGSDDELIQAIETTHEADFEYLGLAATGASDVINEIFGGFSLWRV